MKCLKSLGAHLFFTSGFVFRRRVKRSGLGLGFGLRKGEGVTLVVFISTFVRPVDPSCPVLQVKRKVSFDIPVGDTVWHYIQ